MGERPGPGEQLKDESDAEKLAKVLAYRQRIGDAYESGSVDNVSELILEMKAYCDADTITLVETEMRRERQLLRKDQAQ